MASALCHSLVQLKQWGTVTLRYMNNIEIFECQNSTFANFKNMATNSTKYFLLILFNLPLVSCVKQENQSKSFQGFYKLKFNGVNKSLYQCGLPSGGGQFDCEFYKDTVLFIAVGCASEHSGFYLKGHISEGTYSLNNTNQAWYDNPSNFKEYKTTNNNTGSLTITKGILNDGYRTLNTLEGYFNYQAIDTSGIIVNVTEGHFIMEPHYH